MTARSGCLKGWKGMTKRLALVAFLISLMVLHDAQGEGQDPYLYKQRGNRNEGIKGIPVSAPDLELVSFVAYREQLDAGSDADLKLRFYMKGDGDLYITAKELVVSRYYVMNPTQTKWRRGWQEFSPWPTGEVLRPLGISVDQIGIVGRPDGTLVGSGEIVPLILYRSKLPPSLTRYTLHCRPKEDLRSVTYRVYRIADGKLISSDLLRNLIGGTTFRLVVDLPGEKMGDYKIVLEGNYKERLGGPTRTYRFFHMP
jgi:hypothetical protein